MTFVDLIRERDVRLRLQPSWIVEQSDDGKSIAIKNKLWPSQDYKQDIGSGLQGVAAAAELLAEGATLADLRDAAIEAAGSAQGAACVLLLQRLCHWGLVEFPLVEDGRERAVILPQQASFVPALAPEVPPREAGLDRFACLRRHEGAWLLESPLSGARFRLADLAALDSPPVRRALSAAGFLETALQEDAPRRDALAQWEFHDLLFHSHSRLGHHRDPFGGLFPYIGEIAPPPAVRPPWPGERIALARVPEDFGTEPFARILERRRSERLYDENNPISLRDLGALLDRAARVSSRDTVQVGNMSGRTTPFEITRRPYPNGGASYELEIYPVVDRCDGLESGLYHYDAASHELARLSGRTPEVEQIIEAAKVMPAFSVDPQIVLMLSARFARVMWKYKSIAYAVTLRNTGALYQTLYLAATELGLSPCGIGSGDSEVFARATGLDPTIENSVGEFILGGRPRPS